MRILQVSQRPQRRGAEIFAYQLSQALRGWNHEVRIAYLYPYAGATPLPVQDGDCLLGGDEHHWTERVLGIHPSLLRKLGSLIRQFRPEIVQVNGARTVKYGASAKVLCRPGGWRLVYRNIDDPTYWVRGLSRFAYYRYMVMPRVDGVVGVSQATLERVAELYATRVPSVFIPNGIATPPLDAAPSAEEARRALGVPPDIPLVLFMGSLTAQKRPDRFIRAVQALHARLPHLRAWVVGDGPLRESLATQIDALGLSAVVHLWGYQAQVAPYIMAADLLLVTSDSDGIPAVVLEAGYLGKPTVATRVGGLPECISDEQTGLLADLGDDGALIEAVFSLLQHPESLRAMGARAREFVMHHFTMETVARQYLEFYERLTDDERPTSSGRSQ